MLYKSLALLLGAASAQTPEYLKGRWRLLTIKNKNNGQFYLGEFGMFFDDNTMEMMDDMGQVQDTFDVKQNDIHSITLTNQKHEEEITNMILNEVASTYLSSTIAWGFATNGKNNEPAPYSFYSAMHDDKANVMVGLKCMPTISTDICNFDAVKPPPAWMEQAFSTEAPVEESLIEVKDSNNDYAVCNMETGKCEECDKPSSGSGCMKDCDKDCKKGKPKDYLTECNWDGYRCEQKSNGTFTNKECNDKCSKGSYGKCNFKTEKCELCKQGPDDPDCKYTMDYCKVVESIGQCKMKTFDGISRAMVVDVHNQMIAELDTNLQGTNWWTSYFFNSKKQDTIYNGTSTFLGPGVNGETLFSSVQYDAASKTNKTFYGAHRISQGEANVLMFQETGMSIVPDDKSIKSVADALASKNGFVSVSIKCAQQPCDFSKADPKSTEQTPIEQYYDFLEEGFLQ